MPATLTRTEEALEVDLSTCRGSDFTDTLAKVKEIPGRRYEGARKMWLLPNEASVAERAINSLEPIVDPSIREWVNESRIQTEQELVTPLPEDSDELFITWASERTDWQPQEINGEPYTGLKPHQRSLVANMGARTILADDQGLGKTAEILSFVAECLVRYKDDYELCRVHEALQAGKQGAAGKTESSELSSSPGAHSGNHRREEEGAMHGLRHILASSVHGSGSRDAPSSVLYRALAEHQADAGKVARADGDRGASQVRGALSELPSPEALADRPKLIVCPASVRGVWQREIKQWLGEDAIIANGSSSSARKRQIEEAASEGSWLVVNYEQLRVQKVKKKLRNGGEKTVKEMKEPLFETTNWLAVVADEAHRAKNRKAAQTMGLFRVRGDIMIAATGTPLMNSPDELWALLHWLYPKEYTSYWRFYETYVDYVEGYMGKVVTGVKNPDALRFELHGRMYRRTKDQVLDLPEKQRIIVPVVLGEKQRALYTEAERSLWLEVEKAAEEGDQTATKLAVAADAGVSIYTIPNGAARTVRLRQILSSPALLEGADESAKLDAVIDAISDNAHKPHVVFTEFVKTCDLIVERLAKRKITAQVYTGETTPDQRTRLVEEFQNKEFTVIVGTIPAMKEGLTLTAADTAHFVERAWVPGWNEQAEDRIHRIGAARPVTIYIYEAQDTVDDGRVKPTNRVKERIVSTVLPKDTVKES